MRVFAPHDTVPVAYHAPPLRMVARLLPRVTPERAILSVADQERVITVAPVMVVGTLLKVSDGGVVSRVILPVVVEVCPRRSVKVTVIVLRPSEPDPESPERMTPTSVVPDPEILPDKKGIGSPVIRYDPVFVEARRTVVEPLLVYAPERNVIVPTGAPDMSFVSVPVEDAPVKPYISRRATFMLIVPLGSVRVSIFHT